MSNKDKDKQLKFIFKIIKRKYKIFKYILNENKKSELAPQADLINIALAPDEDLNSIVNSYLIYHKMHFHLKNYLMKLRKKNKGYKNEFIDTFYDIFLDNFLIFKELSYFIYHLFSIFQLIFPNNILSFFRFLIIFILSRQTKCLLRQKRLLLQN